MNDMLSPVPPQPGQGPVQPDTPLTATLPALDWNTVLSALNELPRRVSDPVFQKLMRQLQQN